MSWQKSLADKLGLNVKDFNLLRYLVMAAIVIIGVLYSLANATDTLGDPVKLLGYLTALAFAQKTCRFVLRRFVLKKPKKPSSYGKWAIVTGSTGGLGKAYAEYLVRCSTDSFNPLCSSYGSHDH